ncbi:hypothetical protein DY000_02035091 [Brassica cretica]|uniref:Uncharacterized protein n=1 Tax=Brassica cretica TaxID=69181 RepID=A0ABQ7DSA4_BRACR|nr:hypothetical protein DY000_02035091 [Brassica cretica]
MGFVGKGGKEPMVYVSREGCVCRLSDFSKGRQGGYDVGSVDKGNMLKVIRDGARYVNSELDQSKAEYIAVELVGLNLSDSDKAVRLLFREKLVYFIDWNCQAVTERLPNRPIEKETVRGKGGGDTGKKTEKNRERKGEKDGEGLRSVRRTDRILSPTTLELSGGLTDRLRCVRFWFKDTKRAVNRKNRSVSGHGS